MPTDSLSVLEGQISEKRFSRIEVEYLGGCGEHTFELVVPDRSFHETMTPAINAYLSRDSGNDTCTETRKETLTFDLKPFRKQIFTEIVNLINLV